MGHDPPEERSDSVDEVMWGPSVGPLPEIGPLPEGLWPAREEPAELEPAEPEPEPSPPEPVAGPDPSPSPEEADGGERNQQLEVLRRSVSDLDARLARIDARVDQRLDGIEEGMARGMRRMQEAIQLQQADATARLRAELGALRAEVGRRPEAVPADVSLTAVEAADVARHRLARLSGQLPQELRDLGASIEAMRAEVAAAADRSLADARSVIAQATEAHWDRLERLERQLASSAASQEPPAVEAPSPPADMDAFAALAGDLESRVTAQLSAARSEMEDRVNTVDSVLAAVDTAVAGLQSGLVDRLKKLEQRVKADTLAPVHSELQAVQADLASVHKAVARLQREVRSLRTTPAPAPAAAPKKAPAKKAAAPSKSVAAKAPAPRRSGAVSNETVARKPAPSRPPSVRLPSWEADELPPPRRRVPDVEGMAEEEEQAPADDGQAGPATSGLLGRFPSRGRRPRPSS